MGKGAHNLHHSHHLFHHHEGGIDRRTPLLDGSVTCSVLRVTMSDRSKRHFPATWEGYWSAVISPVYFGKQSKRILTKRDKVNRGPKPPKPPPRRRDPESMLAEREVNFKKLHKRGLVVGLDGHEHQTPDQVSASMTSCCIEGVAGATDYHRRQRHSPVPAPEHHRLPPPPSTTTSSTPSSSAIVPS